MTHVSSRINKGIHKYQYTVPHSLNTELSIRNSEHGTGSSSFAPESVQSIPRSGLSQANGFPRQIKQPPPLEGVSVCLEEERKSGRMLQIHISQLQMLSECQSKVCAQIFVRHLL
jgi:hypothetical protein